MPLNQQPNIGFIEPNNTQTKRGIFKNKTHPPVQIVRPKLSNNVIPMKPDRRKFQSKILNRKEQPKESHSEVKRPTTFSLNEQISKNLVDQNVVSQMDCLRMNNFTSNGSDHFASNGSACQTIMKDSYSQSNTFAVNSVHSLLYPMEHLSNGVIRNDNVKKSATSDIETSVETLSKQGSSKEMKKTPLVLPQVNYSSQSNYFTSNSIEITTKPFSEPSFLNDGKEQSRVNNSTTNIVTLLKKNSSKQLKKLSIPTIFSSEISKSFSNGVEILTSSSVLDQQTIGDNIKMAIEQNKFQLESELKIYHEHLKKYDEEAKDVIHQFTASLEERGKIIKRCEEDLGMFNSRVIDFQQQLQESLDRTRLLESKIALTEESLGQNKQLKSKSCRQLTDNNYQELQSENEHLKENITKLETKLAKRDLHISNLKEILTLETAKIKNLNEAQEEIIKLQLESIDKSNEITVLREELKHASVMRSELINEYDEKIVKLKKLLAIREYLLMKERKS